MPNLAELVAILDETLDLKRVPDYAGAVNGLQLENGSGEVVRLVAAVDASLPVMEAVAAMEGPVLLLVHHGMYWSGMPPLCGGAYRKVAAAIRADMAVYSAHIPLDVHPELGNNVRLAAALGLVETAPFFDWKGIKLGVAAEIAMGRGELVERLGLAVGGPVHVCPGGPKEVRRVGIITGGAGSEIAAVAATGVDTFITGEGPHWSCTAAEELGVNLLYGGHYATETFGVKALAAWLGERAGLPWTFVDHPTGL